MGKISGKACTAVEPIVPDAAEEADVANPGKSAEIMSKRLQQQKRNIGSTKVSQTISQSDLNVESSSQISKENLNKCNLIYSCEHKKQQRVCNDAHELWIVPSNLAGDTLNLKPKLKNVGKGCISYELYDHLGKLVERFNRDNVKIPGWSVGDIIRSPIQSIFCPLFWRRDPQLWKLRAVGETCQCDCLISAYPTDKVEISLGLRDLSDQLNKLMRPFTKQVELWTGKNFNLFEKTHTRLGQGIYLFIEPPQVQISVNAQWIELEPTHNKWWQAFCSWGVRIMASPLFEIGIKADLAEIGINAFAPGLGEVWAILLDWIDQPPPIYASLAGGVNGDGGYEKKQPEKGQWSGQIEGYIKFVVGLEIKGDIIETTVKGETSISLEITCEPGDDEFLMIKGQAKWKGIKVVAEIKIKTGERIPFLDNIGFSKELTLVDESDGLPLIETRLLPEG